MSKIEKQSAALALYENDKVKLAGDQLSALEKTVIAQASFFQRNQPETAMKIVLTALCMRRIKASLKHGEWEPWIKRNIVPIFGPSAPRVVRNWMRLADMFVEDSKLTLPDFLALPGDQTELALSAETDVNARRLMDRLEKFVGQNGPTELMYKHGIRDDAKTAKAKRIAAADSAPPMSAAEKEKTVQDRFNETEAALNLALAGACNKSYWLEWKKQQHQDLLDIFAAAHARVSENFVKTHGRKK